MGIQTQHEEWLERQIELQQSPRPSRYKRDLDPLILKEAQGLSLEIYFKIDQLLSNPGSDGVVADLHKAYGQGLFTPYHMVCYALKRANIYNDHLQAITQLSPRVLHEARVLAESLESQANFSHKPLWGIPIILKDNIATGDDMPNTAGAYALLHATTARPAHLVARLKEAGALILGKANLSEWANFMTLDSPNGYSVVGGQSKNPYGPFDVGGSSSGSCVAVAAGIVPLAVGTETAGSLVYPASQNNVVTIKPTVGLVSRDLIVPISDSQDTAGPIAKGVRDAALMLQCMAGPCPVDAKTTMSPFLEEVPDYVAACSKPIGGMRVGILANERILADYRSGDAAIEKVAIEALEGLGATVERVFVDDAACEASCEANMYNVLLYEFYRDVNRYLCCPDVHNFLEIEDIVKYNSMDAQNRSPYGQVLLEKCIAERIDEQGYQSLLRRNVLRASTAIYGALQGVDVLMSLSNYATILYAAAGYPAVTVPGGFRESGEPVGVTFFAGAYMEERLIQVASAFDRVNRV